MIATARQASKVEELDSSWWSPWIAAVQGKALDLNDNTSPAWGGGGCLKVQISGIQFMHLSIEDRKIGLKRLRSCFAPSYSTPHMQGGVPGRLKRYRRSETTHCCHWDWSQQERGLLKFYEVYTVEFSVVFGEQQPVRASSQWTRDNQLETKEADDSRQSCSNPLKLERCLLSACDTPPALDHYCEGKKDSIKLHDYRRSNPWAAVGLCQHITRSVWRCGAPPT